MRSGLRPKCPEIRETEYWRSLFRTGTFVDSPCMATWDDLRASEPELAAAGERLLRPTGDGFAFLATVSAAGGPRVHPVVPILAGTRLYVFVVSMSPKHEDLRRDGRFALHAMLTPEGGEEFYLTGRASIAGEPGRRVEVREASGGRLGAHSFETLFELDIRRVLYTRWSSWGTKETWPEYRRWRAPGVRADRAAP